MSVVGFDLGNESCVVAVARQRGIDVVLNDESKRETPALVCFGDKQRFLGTATTIAGLHPLRLMHETTATALAYGIYKTDLPENEQLNVAFVDIGHASMQVCIAGFKKGQLKILAHSFDRCLGGRDFDENARACLRLRAACEKLKKVLSANPEAPMNIECLMDDKDVRGFIKRDDFEQISIPILERVKKPLEKALSEAQLTVDDIYAVEVVGSGSRVPAVIKILTEFFGKEPRRTMNASECVSKGCALQCAILSPTFKVREFQVQESFPFPVSLTWKGTAQDSQNGIVENQQSSIVFPKGNSIPSVKALTFFRSGTFTVDLQYADVSELQAPSKISTYTIGPFQATKGERAKVKVKARLNLHGIVSVESAQLIEEEEVDVPVTKEPSKETTNMDLDKTPADVPITNGTDVNMQDASGAENGVPSTGDNPAPMETDAKVEAPKKKVKKSNIPVSEMVYGAMLPADLQKAVEKEFEMALQDRVMEETKDKKNAVEAYVYDMRNKLHDTLHDFVTDSERETFITKLQETEDWLYEDGEDETKGVYIAKLDELKKQGDPIEQRYKEHSDRGSNVDHLVKFVDWYKQAASGDPKYEHIDLNEKQKVLNECSEIENWLREKKQLQDSLPKHVDPVLLSSDIKKKTETLDRPIMSKPKPAPPKAATPETPSSPAPAQADEQPSQEAENGTGPNPNPDHGAADKSSDAPSAMETEKPEAAA
ncbi:hypothetical protein E3N88_40917 [Mikania micrantha]|uniref:Uncharacterized protein n=1 Tax=Mikania micrantha TaxID=192012 RepID=A0A5N6LNX3_9ASTR|nr:hypothetical protein E3N88_40917 [Mikania micrantha]